MKPLLNRFLYSKCFFVILSINNSFNKSITNDQTLSTPAKKPRNSLYNALSKQVAILIFYLYVKLIMIFCIQSPLLFKKHQSKDDGKSTVNLTIFWECESIPKVNQTPAPHTKCSGSDDVIIGLMISNMGPIYQNISK